MQEILLQVAFYFAGKLFVVVVVVCSCYVADVTGLRADKRYICIYTSMYVYIVDSSTHTAPGEARYVVALTRLRFTQRRWQVACCCCCSCTLQRRPRSSQAARPWAHYGFAFGFGSDRIAFGSWFRVHSGGWRGGAMVTFLISIHWQRMGTNIKGVIDIDYSDDDEYNTRAHAHARTRTHIDARTHTHTRTHADAHTRRDVDVDVDADVERGVFAASWWLQVVVVVVGGGCGGCCCCCCRLWLVGWWWWGKCRENIYKLLWLVWRCESIARCFLISNSFFFFFYYY